MQIDRNSVQRVYVELRLHLFLFHALFRRFACLEIDYLYPAFLLADEVDPSQENALLQPE